MQVRAIKLSAVRPAVVRVTVHGAELGSVAQSDIFIAPTMGQVPGLPLCSFSLNNAGPGGGPWESLDFLLKCTGKSLKGF